MANRVVRRVLKLFVLLAVAALTAVAILLVSLWFDHTRSTTLPSPAGSYQVGRATYIWTDDSRVNSYAPVSGLKQELGVWIWYPAAPSPTAERADYVPPYLRRALLQHQGFILGKLLSRDLTRVQTHSWSGADVSPKQPMYPVVVLRAGGGALSTDYTSLAEDLASYGYFVVSFDAPYRTVVTAFPDGRTAIRPAGNDFENLPRAAAGDFANQVMNAWVTDVKLVLNRLEQFNAGNPTSRFKGKLDLQNVGVAGHSLGGATALQFCHDDVRCKAGIDIDGMPFGNVIHDGLHQPFFFIMSDHSKESGPEGREVANNIHSIYSKLPQGARWAVTIIGANHFSFSDQMLTKSSIFLAILRTLGVMGPLEKRRGLAITSVCLHTFFDEYLKGAPAGKLNRLTSLYPEVKTGFVR